MTAGQPGPDEAEVGRAIAARELRLRPVERTPELLAHREAAAELGDALRELLDAAVRTEVPPQVLHATAEAVRGLLPPLVQRLRRRPQVPMVDDLATGVRLYNPTTGAGNPIAPPLRIRIVDGRAEATCTLGLAYEGPHMFGHGGVSAMLLDQILGHAVAAATRSFGMTLELSTRYLRPVPLEQPLRLWASATPEGESRAVATGALCLAAEPDVPLVTATGTFVRLRAEQAMRIFADAERPSRIDPSAAHD